MENIHYIPILLVTVVSAIVMSLVGWKLSTIISNPGVFLQPAADAAARDIAQVCDGKFESKVLPPPPPGASYLVMNCLDRSIAVGTSAIVTAYELYDAAKGFSNLYKAFKKGGLAKNGKALGETISIGETVEVVDIVDDAGNIVHTLVMNTDTVDKATDAVKNARKAIDEASDFRKSMDNILEIDIDDLSDIPENLGNFGSQSKKVGDRIEGLDDELANLENFLENAEITDGKLIVNCAENEGICGTMMGAGTKIENLEGALIDAVEAAKEATRLGDVSTLQRVIHRGVEDRAALNQLWNLDLYHNKVLRGVREWGTLPRALNDFRASNRKARYHIIARWASSWIMSRIINLMGGPSGGVILEYLDESDFFSIIEGSFVGVRYTPYVLNLVDVEDREQEKIDEVIEIYKYSYNVSGELMTVGNQLKDDIPRELRNKGYAETAGYIYNTDAEKLILLGKATSIDSSIVSYATTEYVGKLMNICEDDWCMEYATRVSEEAVNISYADSSIDQLRAAVNSYTDPDMAGIQQDFNEILDYLEQVDEDMQYIADAALDVQKRVGSWMKENCGTEVLHFPDWDVEVASCGMVLDCTPEELCYVGLTVVDADPWIPYIPVTYLEGQDVPNMVKLAGMNYDSAAKVVTPGGLTGCGSISGTPEWEKVYICATLPTSSRCKVVDCGKTVDVIFEYFEPSTWAEDRGDSVAIRGNLLKW